MSELIALVTIAIVLLVPGNCDGSIEEQVEIIVLGDVGQEQVEQVKEVLGGLPQRDLLRTDCQVALRSITLVAGDNLGNLPSGADVFEQHPGWDPSGAAGLAELGTGDIYVAADTDLRSVLYHEIGHVALDGPAKLNIGNVIASWQLTSRYVAGDASLGTYSLKNPQEFRAEAYEHYALNKRMSPRLLEIMNRYQ